MKRWSFTRFAVSSNFSEAEFDRIDKMHKGEAQVSKDNIPLTKRVNLRGLADGGKGFHLNKISDYQAGEAKELLEEGQRLAEIQRKR